MIELMVVLAIVILISTISVVSFGQFRRNVALDAARQDIISALLEARGLSLSSKDASVYGVHFETTQVVRFTGATYSASATSNVTRLFDPRVYTVAINLSGGGSELVFERLTGEASKSGTIVVATYVGDKRATTSVSLGGIIE